MHDHHGDCDVTGDPVLDQFGVPVAASGLQPAGREARLAGTGEARSRAAPGASAAEERQVIAALAVAFGGVTLAISAVMVGIHRALRG